MDGTDGEDEPEEVKDRDFTRYFGIRHGFTYIILDEDEPGAWIRSTWWEPIATGDSESDDEGESEGQQ